MPIIIAEGTPIETIRKTPKELLDMSKEELDKFVLDRRQEYLARQGKPKGEKVKKSPGAKSKKASELSDMLMLDEEGL